jgi:hypothetical protein
LKGCLDAKVEKVNCSAADRVSYLYGP